MYYIYNPSTVKSELEAIFDGVLYGQYTDIYFVGDDVFEAAFKAYPSVFMEKQFANDSHSAKVSFFIQKNKSRATLVHMRHASIFIDSDGKLRENYLYASMTTVLAVDGRYFRMKFKDGEVATLTDLVEVDDHRDYYNSLPYGYDDENPKPSKSLTVLTDEKLSDWVNYITKRQNAHDSVFYKKVAKAPQFVQSIKGKIDPEKCTVYDVRNDGGTVVANNICLSYKTYGDVVYASVEVYDKPSANESVDMFVLMTNTAKSTTDDEKK